MIDLMALPGFLGAPAIKLHTIPLILVILIGAGLAAYEYYEILSKDNE
jgi:hypothetical protein